MCRWTGALFAAAVYYARCYVTGWRNTFPLPHRRKAEGNAKDRSTCRGFSEVRPRKVRPPLGELYLAVDENVRPIRLPHVRELVVGVDAGSAVH